MYNRLFLSRGKTIFAIVSTFLMILDITLNVDWSGMKYDVMVLVRFIRGLRELWIPILILIVLFTAKKNYKLKGTLFSLGFAYLSYRFMGMFLYYFRDFGSIVFKHDYIYFLNSPEFWCRGVLALGTLLIFIGAVINFKLWPLISVGSILSALASFVYAYIWVDSFLGNIVVLFKRSLAIERTQTIHYLVYAIFFFSIFLLTLNKKPAAVNKAAEPMEADDEELVVSE